MALTGNRPLPVEKFSGLRLDVDPSEAGWGAAVDLANVDFDRHGRVRSRQGTEAFTTVAAGTPYLQLASCPTTNGSFLLASGLTLTNAVTSSGSVAYTTARGPFDAAASVGTPSQTECYIAYGSFGMLVFNGLGYATPTATTDGTAGGAMPKVTKLAVTPWDNRLVLANGTTSGGPSSGASSPSHAHFSEPGDPQTFNSNNFELFSPGDGESIAAMVVWRERLFVFKRTKFFVVSGTTVTGGSTGTDATLNYYAIDAGVGPDTNWINQAVSGYDGVYFCDAGGVYRTTGGEPQLVSGAIDPVFRGDAAAPGSFFSGPTSLSPGMQLGAWGRRIVLTTAAGQAFVYDSDTNLWTYWAVTGLGAYQCVEHDFGTGGRLYFPATGSNHVRRFSLAATTDNGTAIASSYRSGFSQPAGAGVECTVRETMLEGAGTVQFGWSRDYGTTGPAANVALSTPPAQGRRLHRRAVAGENLSWRLSATSGAWQVNRIVPYLRDARGAGEMTS